MAEKEVKDPTCADCKFFVYDSVPTATPDAVPLTGECRFESPKVMAGVKESQFPNIEAVKWCSHHEIKPVVKTDKAEKPHTQICPACAETATQVVPTTWVHKNTPLKFECKCGNKFEVPAKTPDTVKPEPIKPEPVKAHAEPVEHPHSKAHSSK